MLKSFNNHQLLLKTKHKGSNGNQVVKFLSVVSRAYISNLYSFTPLPFQWIFSSPPIRFSEIKWSKKMTQQWKKTSKNNVICHRFSKNFLCYVKWFRLCSTFLKNQIKGLDHNSVFKLLKNNKRTFKITEKWRLWIP